jgi:hypothetical protein
MKENDYTEGIKILINEPVEKVLKNYISFCTIDMYVPEKSMG